ncbi:MAG: hypothetical protein J6W40_02290 [Alphaproteobacteria bacterium]|nr:hypothetical protein [Alphaproteobacteria bacterium]
MKSIVSFMVLCAFAMPAFAAPATGRLSVKGPVMTANRTTPGKIASMKVRLKQPTATEEEVDKSSTHVEDTDATLPTETPVDKREKERAACLQNNIGVGNTFVWASRYSNIGDYATMIEDTENPENNACFVLVSLKSADSRIDLGDIRSQYYEMGRNITCGAWVDEDMIEKRILDAKKSGRTWATIGGAVGGAALGVGSMELFGNRLIGGAVEGQKDKNLTEAQLFRSQLLALKDQNEKSYNDFVAALKELQDACKEIDDNDTKCAEYSDLYYLIGSNN